MSMGVCKFEWQILKNKIIWFNYISIFTSPFTVIDLILTFKFYSV